jgi:hypothetical protein
MECTTFCSQQLPAPQSCPLLQGNGPYDWHVFRPNFTFCFCRPSHLLQFVHSARQQLLRAAALIHDTRKLPPLSQVVQINGVLDNAAAHARNLQTTADELFRANQQLLWQRLPLFNVPDALDVLSTGGLLSVRELTCTNLGEPVWLVGYHTTHLSMH